MVDPPVRTWLRLEGAAAFALAMVLFASGDHSWLLFAVLILAPDLSFLGYAGGPRAGAVIYNAAHSYTAPLLLAAVLIVTGVPLAVPLIWCAHIGFDRMLGYGLKYPDGFTSTHLGRIGRARADREG